MWAWWVGKWPYHLRVAPRTFLLPRRRRNGRTLGTRWGLHTGQRHAQEWGAGRGLSWRLLSAGLGASWALDNGGGKVWELILYLSLIRLLSDPEKDTMSFHITVSPVEKWGGWDEVRVSLWEDT